MNHSPFVLSGRRVLLMGATGGVGAAAAHLCGAMGASLVLADRDDPEPLVDALRAEGAAAEGARLDAADREAVERLVAEAGPLDVTHSGF